MQRLLHATRIVTTGFQRRLPCTFPLFSNLGLVNAQAVDSLMLYTEPSAKVSGVGIGGIVGVSCILRPRVDFLWNLGLQAGCLCVASDAISSPRVSVKNTYSAGTSSNRIGRIWVPDLALLLTTFVHPVLRYWKRVLSGCVFLHSCIKLKML